MIQKLEQKKTRKNRKAAKQNAGQLTLCIEGLKNKKIILTSQLFDIDKNKFFKYKSQKKVVLAGFYCYFRICDFSVVL